MNTRPNFDIVVFGATGFTGRLAALDLCKSGSLRIAIAGRNPSKLEKIAAQCAHRPAVIVADAGDAASIRAMVAQAKVVASFAGPFALYGEAVIAACAELGRAYCDITGETPFIREMIDAYAVKAEETGALLLPFAGFDSVPGDVLSYIALEEANRHGWAIDDLKHYYQIKGGFNGGTLLTVLTMAEQKKSTLMNGTNILIPDSEWPRNQKAELAPTYEPLLKRWTAPFMMAPINTAVVRRSIFLRDPERTENGQIHYSERMVIGKGRSGQAIAYAITGALGMVQFMTTHILGRKLLSLVGPSAGEGPSEKARKEGFYRGTLIVREQGRHRLTVKMKTKGDPGNEFTVLCASTIATLLATGQSPKRGFCTPTSAFGDTLVAALEAKGVVITTDYAEPTLDL